MKITLGQIAYESYCANTDWKSLVSGENLPAWTNLSQSIKEAWEAAAEGVRYNCEKASLQRERLKT